MKLYIKNLCYAYEAAEKGEPRSIFSDVNLEIDSGERVEIEGENGSGKTTLHKLLACILEVKQGKISLGNSGHNSEDYKKYMAYVPANPIVFDELTGVEHIGLFCDLWDKKGAEKKRYTQRVYELAEEFRLTVFMKEKVRTYSLGTRYKLFFILMAAREPRLFLLDEPFTSLDFAMQQKAVSFLKESLPESIVVMSSHQKELIEQLATVTYKITDKNIIRA